MKSLPTLIILTVGLPFASIANEGHYYIKPYIGLSSLSDQDAQSLGLGNLDGNVEVSIDGGFFSGLGFGYRYSNNIAAELAWEYRTNDSQTTLADGTLFNDGNYASNTFFLNGYYFFDSTGSWTPYIGAGLGWIQEIDIDLEGAGAEQSFSTDGGTSFQIMAGFDYPLNENWGLNLEARFSSATSIDLEGEGNSGQLNGLDSDPLSLQFGVKYSF